MLKFNFLLTIESATDLLSLSSSLVFNCKCFFNALFKVGDDNNDDDDDEPVADKR